MRVEAGALVRTTAARFGSRPALTSVAGSTGASLSSTRLPTSGRGRPSTTSASSGETVGVLAYNTPEVVTASARLREAQPGPRRAPQPLHHGRPRRLAEPPLEASVMARHPIHRPGRGRLPPAHHRPALRRHRPRHPGWAQPLRRPPGRRPPRRPLPGRRRGRTLLPPAHLRDHRLPQGLGQDLPPLGRRHRPQPAPPRHLTLVSRPSAPTTSTSISTPSSGPAASRPSTCTRCAAPGRCCWTTRPSTPTNCSTRSPNTRPPASSCPARCSPRARAVERRQGGFEHRLRRMVIFFGTPSSWSGPPSSWDRSGLTGSDRPNRAPSPPACFPRTSPSGLSGSTASAAPAARSWRSPSSTRTATASLPARSARSSSAAPCPSASRGSPAKTAEAFFPGDWFRPYDVGYLDEDASSTTPTAPATRSPAPPAPSSPT